MRVAQITEVGRAPEVAERAAPEAAAGTSLLTVEAVSLNPVDVAIASGRFYAGHPPLPYVPGIEAVGRLADGSLVYAQGAGLGIAADGFAAELVAVPDSALIHLPDGTDPRVAAALGTAGTAGWLSVTWRAGVGPDDVVVVLGATGAVGTVAVQAARSAGAARVVAVGRDESRLAQVGTLADSVVVLGDRLAERVTAACGGPPTVVVDMLWGEPLSSLLPVLAPGARVVQVGASAGPESVLPSAAVRGKQLNLLGYSNFAVPREVLQRGYLELLAEASSGRIDLPVKDYPLESVGEAWSDAAGGRAKAVVVFGGPA